MQPAAGAGHRPASDQKSSQRQHADDIEPGSLFQNHVIVELAHHQRQDAPEDNPDDLPFVLGGQRGMGSGAIDFHHANDGKGQRQAE